MILLVFRADGSVEELDAAKILIVVLGNDSFFPLKIGAWSRRFDEL